MYSLEAAWGGSGGHTGPRFYLDGVPSRPFPPPLPSTHRALPESVENRRLPPRGTTLGSILEEMHDEVLPPQEEEAEGAASFLRGRGRLLPLR